MLGITKLLCETEKTEKGINRRHSSTESIRLLQFSKDKTPVVVWNITKRCNLRCIHCYSDSGDKWYDGELTTREAKDVVDDLAGFRVPVIIFSGGDPLLRDDIFEIAAYARSRGIRSCLSTNGVLIGKEEARRIKGAGVAYVGVSIDGIGEFNDRFRGMEGAYNMALKGIRNCRDMGVRTGLRLTLSKKTIGQLEGIFDLAEREGISRIYISHLVYAGRGKRIKSYDLSHEETREAVDLIFRKAVEFHNKGLGIDILTGNNDADGVYLYLKANRGDKNKAGAIYRLLEARGGNSSGTAIGCIDNIGNVHADQFWSHYSLGNVRERPFSAIWTDTKDPIMFGLKNKRTFVAGRCRSCAYLNICGGNYRVRAEAEYGDVWADDPACYLRDEEIMIKRQSIAYGQEKRVVYI